MNSDSSKTTLLPTCCKEIFYCPELFKMFVEIRGKNGDIIKYIPLVDYIKQKK